MTAVVDAAALADLSVDRLEYFPGIFHGMPSTGPWRPVDVPLLGGSR